MPTNKIVTYVNVWLCGRSAQVRWVAGLWDASFGVWIVSVKNVKLERDAFESIYRVILSICVKL